MSTLLLHCADDGRINLLNGCDRVGGIVLDQSTRIIITIYVISYDYITEDSETAISSHGLILYIYILVD